MTRRLLSLTGRFVLVAAVCAGLSSTASAAQEDISKVEKLYAEGATLFNGGRYQEALSRFNEAYATYPAANLLFNIARCHEALGKVDLALSSFRKFVSQPGVDPNTKVLAQKKIADLEEAKKRGLTAPKPAEGAAAAAAAGAEEGPTSYSPWQWVSLGVGAAMVAGGVTSMMLGFSDDKKAEDGLKTVPPMQKTEYDDLRDSASTKKLIGYVLTGVGGAAIVTGVVLLVLELQGDGSGEEADQAESSDVAFNLAPLPGGGAASFALRF